MIATSWPLCMPDNIFNLLSEKRKRKQIRLFDHFNEISVCNFLYVFNTTIAISAAVKMIF